MTEKDIEELLHIVNLHSEEAEKMNRREHELHAIPTEKEKVKYNGNALFDFLALIAFFVTLYAICVLMLI